MVERSFARPPSPVADTWQASRVLVVDDEVKIVRLLRQILMAHGYEVVTATTGAQGLEAAQQQHPDLVVLDLAMSGMDGFSVCRELRQWTAVPIIIVSVLDDERRKVQALDLGADDYLIKPFGTDELLARIRACLRRAQSGLHTAGLREQTLLKSEDGYLVLDLASHRVWVGAQEVHLNRKEFELLRSLMRATGQVLTHRMLLREVWGPEAEEQMEYLRTYISQLRRKVEQDASRPRYILTEPGVGYIFRTPGGAA